MDHQMDMEASLCTALPKELVASIQARLPLVSLVRSLLVCKEWNRAVESRWLLQERLQARGGEQDRLLCVVGMYNSDVACCVYDRGSDRWYPLEFPPWLGDIMEELEEETLEMPGASASGNVLASAVYQQPGEPKRIIPYMGNPMAGSWTSLPEMPGGLLINHILGVFEDARARCFKLVAMHETRSNLQNINDPVPTYVFDSALGSWRLTTSALPGNAFLATHIVQGAFVGRVLYCAAREQGNLLAYDLEQASWRSLVVGRPLFFNIYYCSLVNVGDRLLCVALCLDLHARRTGVRIWELNFSRMSWVVVAAMPSPMYWNHFQRICFPVDRFMDRISVVAGQDSELYIMHEKLDKFVAVDLGSKPAAWRWLPSCPYNRFENLTISRLDPWLELSKFK